MQLQSDVQQPNGNMKFFHPTDITGVGTTNTALSVTGDGSFGNPVELVNDQLAPGNSKYYGTSPVGVKGFFNASAIILPSLADRNIWIGDLFSTANPHALSGIVQMSNTGVVSFNTNSFSSATFAGALTDETGTGLVVFNSNPSFADNINIGTNVGTPFTGTISIFGKTSGKVVVTTQDAAGSWGMKLPTTQGTAGQFLQTDGAVNASTTWASLSSVGAAVTKVDDTNVTMSLTAGSSTAAITAYSMTLGWTGTLAPARGGTGVVTGRPYFSTLFEQGSATTLRYTISTAGGGGVTFGIFGADVASGGAVGGSGKITFTGNVGFNAFARNPNWYCSFSLKTLNQKGTFYIGMGDVTVAATGHTYTDNHIGFKIIDPASNGNFFLYATQADGATENASAALTAIAANDGVELYITENPAGGFDYRYCLNSGTLSSATNLGTTNLPTPGGANATWVQVSCSNNNNANQQEILPAFASYGR